MSRVQFILREGQPEYAILPYNLYLKLLEDAETVENIRVRGTKRVIKAEKETVPGQLTPARLYGENLVKVWRERRKLSQKALAAQAGISTGYLSQIESGKRTGSAETLRAIADAMNLSLDDIVD